MPWWKQARGEAERGHSRGLSRGTVEHSRGHSRGLSAGRDSTLPVHCLRSWRRGGLRPGGCRPTAAQRPEAANQVTTQLRIKCRSPISLTRVHLCHLSRVMAVQWKPSTWPSQPLCSVQGKMKKEQLATWVH